MGQFPFAVADQPDCSAHDSTLLFSLWLLSSKSGHWWSLKSHAELGRFPEQEMESVPAVLGEDRNEAGHRTLGLLLLILIADFSSFV